MLNFIDAKKCFARMYSMTIFFLINMQYNMTLQENLKMFFHFEKPCTGLFSAI